MAGTPYPIAIIGPGAVGLTHAARLAPTLRVAVIARDDRQAAGLRVGVRVGDAWFRADAHGAEHPPAAQWVLVCVKAGDTEAACRIALAMHPQGVLSLQNGLLDARMRAACAPVLSGQGITTLGAYRERGPDNAPRIVPADDGEVLVPPEFAPVADYGALPSSTPAAFGSAARTPRSRVANSAAPSQIAASTICPRPQRRASSTPHTTMPNASGNAPPPHVTQQRGRHPGALITAITAEVERAA